MNAVAERTQVIELVKTLPDEQLDYVMNMIQSLLSQNTVSKPCSLRGRFSRYADSALRAKEKEAWSLAAEEKHALR